MCFEHFEGEGCTARQVVIAWAMMVFGLSLATVLFLTLLFTAHLVLLGVVAVTLLRGRRWVGRRKRWSSRQVVE